MAEGETPEYVLRLQERFSGLTEELHYIEGKGHTIDRRYKEYKAADKDAAAAYTAYNNTEMGLRRKRNDVEPTFNLEKNKWYTAPGHGTLAPLAGTSSEAGHR